MRRPRRILSTLVASLALTACSDRTLTAPLSPDAVGLEESEGRGYFQRYVAIGTSVSAGVASDGLLGAAQEQSWPAQLAGFAHREMSLPLVAWPGCNVPLAAPLALGKRIDGSSATSFSCAPNVDGVVLPTDNVAVDGARADEALYGPNLADASRVLKNSRILPSGMSQVAAMKLQNPKVVSVELGANEVLGARSGILVPQLTLVPFATWQPVYDAVLDEVASVQPKAVVLVGLIDDVGAFPAFRTGSEIYAQRTALVSFGIVVLEACNTTNAANLVFVPVKLPTLAAIAGAAQAPQFYGCDDVPGTQDFTLTPADRATVNAVMAQMNTHIEQQASARGWAFFRLADLYERSGVRQPYSAQQQFLTAQPYGPYISLDGLHPSAAGQTILAESAARALNLTYGMEIPTLLETLIASN